MTVIRTSPVAASEGASYVDFVVTLNAAATDEVRVGYQTQPGSATYSSDFTYQSGTLVFAPGEVSRTVRVLLGDDTVAEGNETFWLDLFDPVNGVLAQRYTTALIADNDATGNRLLLVGDAVADESTGSLTFFLRLNRPSTTFVTVDVGTIGLNATPGSDFTAVATTLSFAPFEVLKTVTVPLLDDTTAEGDELLRLQLSNLQGATLAQSSAIGLIARNDGLTSATAPYVRAVALPAAEGDAFAEFLVLLDTPSAQEVRVSYQADPGSARYGNDADYLYVADQLVFAPGETVRRVQVPLVNDGTAEGAEVLWLQLHTPVNATLVQRYTPLLVIDNDANVGTAFVNVGDAVVDEAAGSARFTVWLSRPATGVVSVEFATADGTATAGSDYQALGGSLAFAPGEMVKTLTVPLTNDGLAEGDELFTLRLTNALGGTLADATGQALIGRNDNISALAPRLHAEPLMVGEGDRYASFLVQLDHPSESEVRVSVQTTQGSARYDNTSDFAYYAERLVFAPGETTRQVNVPLVNDSAIEGSEYFWLELYSPDNAELAQRLVAARVIDDDGLTTTPVLMIGDVAVDEGGQRATFQVWLSRPAASLVTVDYETQDGSARAGLDFLATRGSLQFAPGEMVRSVTVPLLDDTLAETDELFTLLLSGAVNATLADASAMALIGRSDGTLGGGAEALPRLSVRPLVLGEAAGFATFVVQLDAPSTAPVRVSVQTGPGSASYEAEADFAYINQTLVFAPGETTQQLQVPITNDGTAERAETFWLTLYDAVGAQITQRYVPALVIDDDATSASPAISVGDAVVDEAEGVAYFSVTLSRPYPKALAVPYTTVDDSALAGLDYLGSSGTLVFGAGEVQMTLAVSLLDDALAEGAERFSLRITAAPAGATIADGIGSALIGAGDGPVAATPTLSATPLVVSEGDRFASFVVRLSAPSASAVQVSYETDPGSARYASGSDLADYLYLAETLVFAPGETVKLVQVALTDDTTAEDSESFTLNLYNPVNATLPERFFSATVLDNDGAGTLLSFGRSNDVYTVASAQDRIAEGPDGGTDTVRSSVSLQLAEHLENLVLTGSQPLQGTGNAADNLLRGNSGSNRLDGGAGIDTAVFGGNRAAYTLGGNAAERTVTGGTDGSDTLLNIERLQFADVLLADDTRPGGHVHDAYALMYAAFARAPTTAEASRWTAQRDQLGSAEALAQAMIDAYAPGVDDASLVGYLWQRFTGTPIDAASLAQYVGLLADGTYTQASLLTFTTTLDPSGVAVIVGQTVTLDAGWFPVPG